MLDLALDLVLDPVLAVHLLEALAVSSVEREQSMAAALTMVGTKDFGAWPSCGGAYAGVMASGSFVLFHFELRWAVWSAVKQHHRTLMIGEFPCFALQARSAVSPIPYSTIPQAMWGLRLFLEVTDLFHTRVTQLRGVAHAVRPYYLYPCIKATLQRAGSVSTAYV